MAAFQPLQTHPSPHSFSLWLMPKGTLAERLQHHINNLADSCGAPRFPPHVTLLGGVTGRTQAKVAELAQQLANSLEPWRIELDRVTCGTLYHQCVYIKCREDQATMEAGAMAREVFGLDPHGTYMPHLSLLYSDVSLPERERIAVEMQACLLDDPEGLPDRRFEADVLAVWSTPAADKELRTWHAVAELPLRQAG